MIAVKVSMKVTHEPLKRTPVVLKLDADGIETQPVLTDRAGMARFDLPPTSGSILVSGLQRYDGRLDGEGNQEILTDSEGYLVNPSDWSEGFTRALAALEGLVLTTEHWEVIRYLRASFARHGTQATVRDMIAHFRQVWGRERGNNRYLHQIFPRGGPQKQGNRLAGLLRTKGEH